MDGDDFPPDRQFCLPETRSHFVRSSETLGEYRIDIAVPETAPPDAGWPSVFLLDASGCFATCVEAMRRMSRRPDATGVAPMVVVGISSSKGYDVPRRQRDFTSDRSPETGGAGAFLTFIETEVKALAAREARLDPEQQTLCGHSLAGYFTLWALANRPEAFRSYAAISPSIWWDRDGLFRAISELAPQERQAMIFIGEWETALPPWQRAAPGSAEVERRRQERQMLANAQDAAKRLAPVLGEHRVRFHHLADEDHASIISSALPRVLRMASGN